MKKILLPIIAILLISISAQAQVKADTSKVDPTLSGQYQLMLSKSKTLNGYKLVNPSRLSLFWKNVRDSLAVNQKQLVVTRKKIQDQTKEISELNKQITGTESSLATSNAKLNEISFLGIGFTKGNYNLIVWGLIITLAIALAIIILRSAKHIHEAKYRSTLYEEISQEYQNYKTKANEKEKKLARELQDERNKLDEFKNRGK
jgi:peptidoglycan hydrolase CwlO-like protein